MIRRGRKGLGASLLIAGLGLLPTTAAAQDEEAEAQADRSRECFELAQADACFSEGRRLYKAEDIDGAYKAYKKAWELKRSYEVAANLGNVEIKLEKWGDAYVHMWWAKENAPVTSPPEVFEKLEDKKREALKYTSARFIKVAHEGTEIRGATVTIDGAEVGATPLDDPIPLDPGTHEITIAAKGYETLTKKLETKIGTSETVTYELTLKADEVVVVKDPGHEPILPLIIAGGVVGLGAIGAGAGLLAVSSSKGSERQDLVSGLSEGSCSNPTTQALIDTCANIADLADQENTFSSAGTGLLIGGGVVTLATILYASIGYALYDPEADGDGPAATLRFTPYASPTEQGFTLGGRF